MFYRIKLAFTRPRYRRPEKNREGIVVLSPARKIPLTKSSGGNSAKAAAWPIGLAQKRMLKMELECRQRTLTVRKNRPQMLHGLQEWLGLPAGRWGLLPAKPRPQFVQPPPQAASQPIERFQGEGQPQFFRGGFEGKPRQHFHQPRSHPRSRQSVTRQNLGQHQGKCFPAATALAAIGTKHPLTTSQLTAGLNRIVAAQNAVPVQCLAPATAGAALLLEGKSACFSAGSSRTK